MNVYACKAGETENKTEKERKILLTSDFFLFSKINFVQCIVLMKRLNQNVFCNFHKNSFSGFVCMPTSALCSTATHQQDLIVLFVPYIIM